MNISIQGPTSALEVKAGKSKSQTFVVTNSGNETYRIGYLLESEDAATKKMVELDKSEEIDLGPNVTTEIKVNIIVPKETPAARKSYRLVAYKTDATNITVQSEPVYFDTVPDNGKKCSWCIPAAIAAAVVLVAVLVVVFWPKSKLEIVKFDAGSEGTIKKGEKIELSWETKNAKTVTLNGETVPDTGKKTFEPPNSTKYELEAKDNKESAKQSIQVVVIPPEPVIEFSSDKQIINKGQSARLTWKVKDADKVSLNGESVPPSGNRLVSPGEDAFFQIIADYADGSVNKTLQVKVAGVPSIVFNSNKLLVTPGEAVQLNWKTTNAAEVKLNGKVVGKSGGVTEKPRRSTKYALAVKNAAGSTTMRHVDVMVIKTKRFVTGAGTNNQVRTVEGRVIGTFRANLLGGLALPPFMLKPKLFRTLDLNASGLKALNNPGSGQVKRSVRDHRAAPRNRKFTVQAGQLLYNVRVVDGGDIKIGNVSYKNVDKLRLEVTVAPNTFLLAPFLKIKPQLINPVLLNN